MMLECGQPEGTWKEDLSALAYASFPENEAASIMKFYDSGFKGDGISTKRVCTARNLSDQKALMEDRFAKFRESYPAIK
jgi:hypothetical protein